MAKTCKLLLWTSSGERGHQSRPANVEYELLPIGSGRLYKITKVTDAWLGTEYPVASILSLNDSLDELISAANPEMVEFAKESLGIDITRPSKVKSAKPKTIPFPEHPTLDIPS